METATNYLDQAASYFTSLGIHPVLGGAILGAVLMLLFRRRGGTKQGTADRNLGRPRIAPFSNQSITFRKTTGTMDRPPGNIGAAIKANLDLDADTLNELNELLQHGEKINAIKLFREKTNLGLAEAKSVIDALEARIK